jgi:DNA invertase Pin-like site-specific DNA recombinase
MARRKTTGNSKVETVRQAVIYCRVSTSEQADSGLGLESQQAKCEAYCTANDLQVAGVFVDAGVSAKTAERPQLERALKALVPGAVLVVLKLDRLTRNVADLQPLADRISDAGADWCAVQEKFDTSTATGRLMLRMVLELSQWEREVIAERTSSALQAKRTRGERLGTTPLGFKTVEGVVTVDESEQATVERARQLRSEGLTLRAIASRLTDEGHQTKRGGRWEAATVNLLLKPRYIESHVVCQP